MGLRDQQEPSRVSKRKSKGEFDVGELLSLLSRHKLILLTLAIFATFGTIYEHYTFPSFKGSARISIQSAENNLSQAVSARMSGMQMGGGYEMLQEVPDKYFQLLGSYDYYLRVAKKFKELPTYEVMKNMGYFRLKSQFEEMGERLKSFVKGEAKEENHSEEFTDDALASVISTFVRFGKGGADNIIITVATPNSRLTQELINIFAQEGAKFITDNEIKELNAGEEYLKVELAQSEQLIRDSDNAIVDFKKDNKLLSIENAQGGSSNAAIGLKRELEEINVELEQDNKLLDSLMKDISPQELNFLSDAQKGDANVAAKPRYGIYKKVVDLKKDVKFLTVRKATIKKVLNDLLNSQDPHAEQKIFDLRRKMELEYGLYQELKKQLFQIEMQRIFVKNRVRPGDLVREGDVGRALSLKKKMMIAIIFSVVMGGLMAFISEYIMPRVRNRDDLEEMNTVYIGSIPDISRLKAHQKHQYTMLHGSILAKFDIDSAMSTAIKQMRTKILHVLESDESPGQIISIHSAKEHEGKSFTASNLAACIAQLKRKTLIVDCDIRRSTVSRYFGFVDTKGLVELLHGHSTFDEVVKTEVTSLVDILPAGGISASITELIAGERFVTLLSSIKARYDYIILDAPPVLQVPDSVLIAQRSDYPIMIALNNKTTKENYSAACEMMISMKKKTIYSTLNKVKAQKEYIYIIPERMLDTSKVVKKTKT